MEIKRVGSQSSVKGLSEWFTGAVRIDQPFQASDPARVGGATVTFELGARTAWHTHPLGQTLIVIAGCGRAQREGGPIEEIRPGDVVWFPAHEKHWHGAAPTTAMSHIAIAETSMAKLLTGWSTSAMNSIKADIWNGPVRTGGAPSCFKMRCLAAKYFVRSLSRVLFAACAGRSVVILTFYIKFL